MLFKHAILFYEKRNLFEQQQTMTQPQCIVRLIHWVHQFEITLTETNPQINKELPIFADFYHN